MGSKLVAPRQAPTRTAAANALRPDAVGLPGAMLGPANGWSITS